MGFTVPVSVNYSSPLNAVPLDWISPPVEGAKGIQCSIQWNAAQAGPNKSVAVNLQNNAPLNFSKVRALVFDNSANGSDVQVIFPDTETTMTIPSYTPYAVIPVFTNVTQFFIVSPNALSTDKTGFMILNTLPPPIAVPVTEEQNFIAAAGINTTVDGTSQLVAATVNGTLENLSLAGFLNANAVNNGTITYWLQDGTGQILYEATAIVGINLVTNLNYALSGLRVRFAQGISLRWTVANPLQTAYMAPSLYYRTP